MLSGEHHRFAHPDVGHDRQHELDRHRGPVRPAQQLCADQYAVLCKAAGDMVMNGNHR
jgi:hypothetical protein